MNANDLPRLIGVQGDPALVLLLRAAAGRERAEVVHRLLQPLLSPAARAPASRETAAAPMRTAPCCRGSLEWALPPPNRSPHV